MLKVDITITSENRITTTDRVHILSNPPEDELAGFVIGVFHTLRAVGARMDKMVVTQDG